jgi:predicted TIM-barrel fold metal-dependent hydrolase
MERSSVVRTLCLLQLVMLAAAQTPPPLPPPTAAPIAPVAPVAEKIDTHCHYIPPFYRELLNSRNITAGGLAIPAWNVSAHLAVNAMFGIKTSVIAVSTPGAKLSASDPIEEGRTLARQLNEYGYNLTQEYPGKFLFWATLTLPDVDGAVAEAIYALDSLGAAGVIIEASVFGNLLGTPDWAPLYKVLDDRAAVVFVHPSNSPCPDAPIFLPNSTDIPPYVIDFLLDTSRAAVNLVYRNVTTDYPNIKFILAHSGGFLPFAAYRAAGGLAILSGAPSAAIQEFYLGKLKNDFHVDLAISATPTALPSTTDFFNVSQITFGSDFPYAPVPGIVTNVQEILTFRFKNSARRKIDYSNAFGIFKKFLKK